MAKHDMSQFRILMWKHCIETIKNPDMLLSHVIIPYLIILTTFRIAGVSDTLIHTQQNAEFGMIANPLECCQMFTSNAMPNGNESHILRPKENPTLELAYAPNNSFNKKVFEGIVKEYNLSLTISGFPNEVSARNYVEKNKFAAMILLNRVNEIFNVTIQKQADRGQNSIEFKTADWSIPFLFQKKDFIEARFGRFLNLEAVLTDAILSEVNRAWKNETREKFIQTWKLSSFPSWKILTYNSIHVFRHLFLMLLLSTLPLASSFARTLVEEKESGVKDYMKVSGLSESMYLFTWLLRFAILQLPLNLLIVFTYQYWHAVFICSNVFLVFVLFTLHHICFGSYIVMVSSLFHDPAVASLAVILSWLTLSVILAIAGTNVSFLQTCFQMLFSNYCFLGAFRGVLQFDHLNLGFTWANLLNPPHPMLEAPIVYMVIMSIEIFLYITIAWYICNIKPGKYGIRKYSLFSFMRSKKVLNESVKEETFAPKYPKFIQDEHPSRVATIKIVDLVKDYKSFRALKGINLKAYRNEILVFLGHNGAGKTTTMSVMTGMLSPTRGTIFINDYDIRNDIDVIRRSLSYCPQHDILFAKMTVKDHLLFFAALKKTPKSAIAASVSRMLHISGLVHKSRTKSMHLSGGMKRRLSISIAFVGGSNIVVLDEPTSGLDPASRRSIWNLIQTEASRATILLSTHNMDEADYLGHRIAIMGKGEIYCCGTPMFLKSVFQVGYHLTIVKGNNFNSESTSRIIQDKIHNASVAEDINTELEVLLPQDRKSDFSSMFKILEAEKSNLGIMNISITFSGMEDLFIIADRLINETSDKSPKETSSISKSFVLERSAGLETQLVAVCKKKWYYLYYSKRLIIVQIVIPWLIASFTLLYSDVKNLIVGTESAIEVLPLSLDMYKYVQKVLLYVENHSLEADVFRDILKKEKYLNRLEVHNETISEFLMDTAKNDHNNFPQTAIFGVDFTQNATTFYYNQEAIYAGLVSGTYLLTTFFHSVTKMTLNFNMEFNSTLADNSFLNNLLAAELGKVIAVGFALSSVAASFLFLLISEQITQFKQIQLSSGLKIEMYWFGNFVFDLLYFFIVIAPIMILFYFQIFNNSIYLIPLLLLTLLYVPLQLLNIYLLSFGYDSDLKAFLRVYILYALGGIMLMFIRYFFFGLDMPFFYRLCDFCCTSIPMYLFEIGLLDLRAFPRSYCSNEADVCCVQYKKYNFTSEEPIPCPVECTQRGGECRMFRNIFAFEYPGIGFHLLFLCSHIIIGLVLLCCMEKPRVRDKFRRFIYNWPCFWCSPCLGPCCHCCPPLKNLFQKSDIPNSVVFPNPDNDVMNERERILNRDTRSDIVIIDRLGKEYGQLTAVREICLGIPLKECFGLLGINGAGKTTTFMMLIGEESITRGDAYLHGQSVRMNFTSARRYIGYCPQAGGLLDKLPADKLLTYIATLRGHKNAYKIAEILAQQLGFEQDLMKPIKNMSGGTQRKVSIAVALIGLPPILFMDEPTTGMDPSVKRKIWSVLSEARDQGSCIILTSQSMEECEALCTRLTIMVSGEFCCLGSPQRLKDKYAKGYVVVIKLLRMDGEESQHVQMNIINALNMSFPGCKLQQSGVEVFHVIIPGDWPWDVLFDVLETIANNPNLFVEDYQLTQASLDDVFLAIINNQQFS